MVNVQIQLVRNQEALPLTRDYMFEEEAALRAEAGERELLRIAGAEEARACGDAGWHCGDNRLQTGSRVESAVA